MKRLSLSILFTLCTLIIFCQSWQQYTTPEEAGWSSEKISKAWEYADEIGSAAFMLIHDGKVVACHGDISRRYMCHSVRKSLLSALYGIYVDNRSLDIDQSLAGLSIDDVHQLTDGEKKATIRDMLKARSGVFHPAAYETEAMKNARPARGSHPPNTFWYYNNWDFNTLCAILMEHSGNDFFEDFKDRIGDPIGMEDFRMEDTYYHLEIENSKYPAYPFRLSARDLARLGQLFLQQGQWQDKQLISNSWIRESTKSYSPNARRSGQGYGYMWWTSLYGNERPNFSAQGVGNQAVIVFPEDNVVMVNRTNTFVGNRVDGDDLKQLTRLLWEARISQPVAQPKFKKLIPERDDPPKKPAIMTRAQLDKYTGAYELNNAPVAVGWHQNRLQIDTPFAGKYYLIPVEGNDTFMAEDSWFIIQYERMSDGSLGPTIHMKRGQD